MVQISAAEAEARKSAGWAHVDVRTISEYGKSHPSGTVNVEYMRATKDGMKLNNKFVQDVAALYSHDAKILVSCASGKRSARAVKLLEDAGFVNVADVVGGLSSYKNDNVLKQKLIINHDLP